MFNPSRDTNWLASMETAIMLTTELQTIHPARVALCMLALCLYSVAQAAAPGATEPTTTAQLQQQTDELTKQLAQVQTAADPAARQQAMQRHWSMMLEHMRNARMMPGMTANGNVDWMMVDPNMMGSRGTAGRGWMGHGMMGMGKMGPRMMGPGMMGTDQGWWAMPPGMPSDQYRRQMQGMMQQMHQQVAAIAAEKDPAKRLALIRDHYETMYRGMQSMRGMGWMWATNAAAALPDSQSSGAQLVAKYCSQCHAAPSPAVHTNTEWSAVTSRMRDHIHDLSGSSMPGLKTPSAAELDAITDYLGKHAATAH